MKIGYLVAGGVVLSAVAGGYAAGLLAALAIKYLVSLL